jgi:hypothetical protein
LNAWARLLLELCGDPRIGGGRWAQAVKARVVRTDTLRLLATPELDDFLRRAGDATLPPQAPVLRGKGHRLQLDERLEPPLH